MKAPGDLPSRASDLVSHMIFFTNTQQQVFYTEVLRQNLF